ncbi:hypothetical protein ACK2M2_12055 [Acinetobacter sp. TY1]|uniref:hypothetical protein n=1 Tax=unclassified Acinetobacter TaxID=196816 RepID=UPI003042E57F
MKFITIFKKIVLAKLSQLEKRIQSIAPQDPMDQAIARAHTSQAQLFQMDYLE